MRKGWLGLYLVIFCIILVGLVLSTQIDVEDTVRKCITCTVVTVLCLWSIGVFMCLFRKRLRLPHLQSKLLWFSSMSTISMVGCWVVTTLPLTFELYLSVSSNRMGCRILADSRGCLFPQPTRRACLVRLLHMVKVRARHTFPFRLECFGIDGQNTEQHTEGGRQWGGAKRGACI